MAFTLCNSGAATKKAGDNVSSTILADSTALDNYSIEAEGYVMEKTGTDWVTDYASLNNAQKGILSMITSSHIGNNMLKFDTTGYYPGEVDIITNHNDDQVERGIKVLIDRKNKQLETP